MCKIVVFTKAPFADQPDKQRALFDDLLHRLGRSEHDGLGIAYIGVDGKIHKRRWSYSEAFKGITDPYVGKFPEWPSSDPPVTIPAQGFVILHGRTATSARGLINSHPHCLTTDDGTEYALIHNGMVSVDEAERASIGKLVSGCDSELILSAFALGGMPKVSEIVRGWYAFAVIVKHPDGNRHLHVVKDKNTSLHASDLKDGTYIFATTEDLLKHAGGVNCCGVSPLQHAVFDAAGQLSDVQSIPEPKQRVMYSYPGYVRGSTVPFVYAPCRTRPAGHSESCSGGSRRDRRQRYPHIPEDRLDEMMRIDRKIEKAINKFANLGEREPRNEEEEVAIETAKMKLASRLRRLRENRDQKIKDMLKKTANVGIHAVPLSQDMEDALREAQREAAGISGDPECHDFRSPDYYNV